MHAFTTESFNYDSDKAILVARGLAWLVRFYASETLVLFSHSH